MSLYDRIRKEAEREGIEYQPPPFQSRREQIGELRTLKSYVYPGPTSCWSAMAYASLKRKYPAANERYQLQKNGGHWMFGFKRGENRSKNTPA